MEELEEMEDSERERLEDMIAAITLAQNPDQVKEEIEELKELVEHASESRMPVSRRSCLGCAN